MVPLAQFVASAAPLGDTEVVSSITISVPAKGALSWYHRVGAYVFCFQPPEAYQNMGLAASV